MTMQEMPRMERLRNTWAPAMSWQHWSKPLTPLPSHSGQMLTNLAWTVCHSCARPPLNLLQPKKRGQEWTGLHALSAN